MSSIWYDQKKASASTSTDIYACVTWTPNTQFANGSFVRPTVYNGNIYKCTTTNQIMEGLETLINIGQSGLTEPDWNSYNISDTIIEQTTDMYGNEYEICRWVYFGNDPAGDNSFSFDGDTDYNTGTPTVDNCMNFKDSSISLGDTGNQQIINGINPTSISFPLIQKTELATSVAARELKKLSYPLAEGTCKFNRSVFRLEKGDTFCLKITSMYGIESMPVIVTGIVEEGPDSDAIIVNWIEDPNYISQSVFADLSEISPYALKNNDPNAGRIALNRVRVFELPYGLTGEAKIKVGLLAGRVIGSETGFNVYFSSDGNTYTYVTRSSKFSVCGKVAIDYIPPSTVTIDDTVGVEIDFDLDDDVAIIESITRGQIGSLTNLALLGDEFISFQTIVPVTGHVNRYKLTGVYGGRFDTERSTHVKGELFWFLGAGRYEIFENDGRLMKDSVRYFKLVPFTTDTVGRIDYAAQIAVAIQGSALIPYKISNLKINGQAINPRYKETEDITITWNLRLKDTGAGVNVLENLESTSISPIYMRLGVNVGNMGIINGKTAFIPELNNEGNPITLPMINLRKTSYTIPNAELSMRGYKEKAIQIALFPLIDINQTRFNGKTTILTAYLSDWVPEVAPITIVDFPDVGSGGGSTANNVYIDDVTGFAYELVMVNNVPTLRIVQ